MSSALVGATKYARFISTHQSLAVYDLSMGDPLFRRGADLCGMIVPILDSTGNGVQEAPARYGLVALSRTPLYVTQKTTVSDTTCMYLVFLFM
jgi:hypothetical protein